MVPFTFEKVKFFEGVVQNKKETLHHEEIVSEVKNACHIIEQRLSPEILCDFEKLFLNEGSVTLDQTHISLYHLWHNLKPVVIEKNIGKVATVVTSRTYADDVADFSSLNSINKTPLPFEFSCGTITAPENFENIILENF